MDKRIYPEIKKLAAHFLVEPSGRLSQRMHVVIYLSASACRRGIKYVHTAPLV